MELSDNLLVRDGREVGYAVPKEGGAAADCDDVEEKPVEAPVGDCILEDGLILGRARHVERFIFKGGCVWFY